MPDTELIDAAARDKIATVLDKNLLVEAGAGSGKTTSLVDRMVALVKSGKYRAPEIAAITFTRKAAAELKERFHSRLEQVCREAASSTEKKNLKLALEELDQSFTGTIHSFCARLIRERPVEAGVDPEFEELDELEEKNMIEQAWQKFLQESKLKNQDSFNKLYEMGVSPLDLKDSFIQINMYSEVEINTEKVNEPDLKPALKKILDFVKEASRFIPDREPDRGYDKLQEKVKSIRRQQNFLDFDQNTNIVRILSTLEGGTRVTLNRWLDKDKAREYKDEKVDNLKNLYIEPALRQWREYCHYHIAEFLKPAVKYYRKMRQKEAAVNFQDLLIKTAQLLKNNPEVREYFQDKIKCLLIDEFQDTDPIQAEIIFYLTGFKTKEKEWTRTQPVPGSLFVVGDPKQSIYRFRRADIDIYNKVKELIQKSGGEVVSLSSNFRSLNGIAAYLNPIFTDILPEEDNKYQARYVPLNTVHDDEFDCGVKMLPISDKFTRKDEIVAQDADYIARVIKSAVEGNMKLKRTEEEIEKGLSPNPTYQDFMILLRYKDCLDVYARTLEEYGIPTTMTGGSTLDSAPEVRELYNLLKLLTDINNRVLLVAVLRGLFFGLSDEELYKFKKNNGYFNIYSQIPAALDDGLKETFTTVFNKIKKYHKWSQKHTPTLTLEKIMDDLGLLPYVTTRDMNKSRCGNLFFLLERLRQKEDEKDSSFNSMVEQFGIILDSSPEQELNLTLANRGVQIMNLHKAKGLEAPVVFLAHPYKNVDITPDYHIERKNGKPAGYFLFTKNKRYYKEVLGQPVKWDYYREEESRYQDAEEKRLLYVAATRAKNLLVISKWEKNDKKNPWQELLANMTDEQVLDIPEAEKSKQENTGVEITEDIYRQKEAELNNWPDSLKISTYNTLSPTEFKDKAGIFSIDRQKGGGQSWGTMIHKVLERLVAEEKIENTFIERNLTQNNLPLARKEEVEDIIHRFKASDLWDRLKKSDERYTEVPFNLKVNPDHQLYDYLDTQKESSVILSGVIDLIFREKDGWIIVDYKTDNVENEEDVMKLKELYKPQVEIYAGAWEEITEESVKETKISFINEYE